MPAKVIVRDLRKHYGAVQAASGVSFEVQVGEISACWVPTGRGRQLRLSASWGCGSRTKGI